MHPPSPEYNVCALIARGLEFSCLALVSATLSVHLDRAPSSTESRTGSVSCHQSNQCHPKHGHHLQFALEYSLFGLFGSAGSLAVGGSNPGRRSATRASVND